jgi:hypothetical protein
MTSRQWSDEELYAARFVGVLTDELRAQLQVRGHSMPGCLFAFHVEACCESHHPRIAVLCLVTEVKDLPWAYL